MEKNLTEAHDREAELLQQVRLKEEAIEQSLQDVRAQAEARLQKAHKDAQEHEAQARETAQQEARQYQESRRIAFQAEAAKILEQAGVEADQVRSQADRNMPRALELIVSQVVPAGAVKRSILSGAPS